MSDITPNLALPYIAAAQAQKHVTHNEAIRALDALVQITVADRDLATPPEAAADGDRYIIATAAMGAWEGQDNTLAAYQDGAWAFYRPQKGWLAWVEDENALIVWDGGAWTDVASYTSIDQVAMLGINTAADGFNKLTVKSDAVLHSHDDVTPGSGDVRHVLNKKQPSNTASLVFQSGFSGRAEFGITGDDQFRIKVSPDGSTWFEAIVVNNNDGSVSFPNSAISAESSAVTVAKPGGDPDGNGSGSVPKGAPAGQMLNGLSSPTDDNASAWSTPILTDSSMHIRGMLAEWRFNEGSGTVAADIRGGNNIVFDEDFRSKYASNPQWTRRGLLLEHALIQTPMIEGIRTVAVLFRVKRNNNNPQFLISGGPKGSGDGIAFSGLATNHHYHVGGGAGVAPLRCRLKTGQAPYRLNRGGWLLLFLEYETAANTKLGFGGRHDRTDPVRYRPEEIEYAWAACWSDTLTGPERQTVYEGVRKIAADRSIFIDWRDCPETMDCVLLWGQSNADGRALQSGLSAVNAARPTPLHTLISTGDSAQLSNFYAAPEPLRMGCNNQRGSSGTSDVATQFGPEMPAAWRREDDNANRVRKLVISKFAGSGSFLAPSSVAGVNHANTWHPDELATGGLYTFALTQWWDIEQRLLGSGIGPRLRALWWMQGEQDATGVAFSANYQADLQNLFDQTRLYTGFADMRAVIGRIRDQARQFDVTAAAEVRAAQSAFVETNSMEATLIDTDGFTLRDDLMHYDAAGMVELGQAFYDATVF